MQIITVHPAVRYPLILVGPFYKLCKILFGRKLRHSIPKGKKKTVWLKLQQEPPHIRPLVKAFYPEEELNIVHEDISFAELSGMSSDSFMGRLLLQL